MVPWYARKVAYKPKPTKKAENFQHLRDVATTKSDLIVILVVKGWIDLNVGALERSEMSSCCRASWNKHAVTSSDIKNVEHKDQSSSMLVINTVESHVQSDLFNQKKNNLSDNLQLLSNDHMYSLISG